MSKRARALIIGAMLAAMNLAGTTTLAHAHTNDDPTSQRHRALGQLELLTAEHAVASQEQPITAEAVEAFRRGERASQDQPTTADTRRPPTEAQVGEAWRHPKVASVRPPKPSGQPGWLVASLGVLAGALVLAGGLAVLAAKRAGRRARVGHAA